MKRACGIMLLAACLACATPPDASVPGQATAVVGESQPGLADIPESHRKSYFDRAPDGFLSDPQHLLGSVVRRDRLAFLEYHAGDSSIDLHVYLLAGDQAVPAKDRCEEVMARYFSAGKPAAVVWYPFGAPERAALYLSAGLHSQVPDAESKRALASSVMQAVEKSDPASQLEAFLVQMSIRLYWMERLMAGGETERRAGAGMPSVPPDQTEEVDGDAGRGLDTVVAVARDWSVEGGVIIGVGVLLVAGWVWRRSRTRHVLPDFSVEPRLGGEHGAGVGAVISFASASVPPASQRGRWG